MEVMTESALTDSTTWVQDWALLQLRYELFLLQDSFKKAWPTARRFWFQAESGRAWLL